MSPENNLAVGTLELNIHGAGRRGRWNGNRVTFRSDACVWQGKTMYMASVVGPESAIKAFCAALHGENRVEVRANNGVQGDGHRGNFDMMFHPDGYTITRTKILPELGLWQALAVVKSAYFLPYGSCSSLWQYLQSDRYTTPLLAEWIIAAEGEPFPWLVAEMKRLGHLVLPGGFGATSALVFMTTEQLDDLVSRGIAEGHLAIGGKKTTERARGLKVKGLDDYMEQYGPLLGRQAAQALEPLHVPGRDSFDLPPLLRQPFKAQVDVIAALVKQLRRDGVPWLSGECGSGKTIMSMVAYHAHAAGKPYRALVFCPGTLTDKWKRELEETIPDVRVTVIESWRDLIGLDRSKKPAGAEWYVIARDRAKLGSYWNGAVYRRSRMPGPALCPRCGRVVLDDKGQPLDVAVLNARKMACRRVLSTDADDNVVPAAGCGEQLWQCNRQVDRYAPATYIKRKLKGFFRYLVVDEAHQEMGANTAQANAMGELCSVIPYKILMTGTLANGYALPLKHLLFRTTPRSLVAEGITWEGDTTFTERYGRVETVVTESARPDQDGDENRMSRGKTVTRTVKHVRPGIMPTLFARHLLRQTVFVSLAQVSDDLPEYREELVPVRMEGAHLAEYQRVENELRHVIKQMLVRGDRRMLGAFLQTLLAYPDYPFDWGWVGYQEGESFRTVVRPRDMDPAVVLPKEKALLDLCKAEKEAGRQVWVYVQFTDKHDVLGRLKNLLTDAGLRVGVLRASVSMEKREEWIRKNGPGLDVAICHPKMVETGLDLFDKGGRHNFTTLIFYETGYQLPTLRQASRRSWRIGQNLPCRTYYLYYEGTMQDRAVCLMAKKLSAALALEGEFSSDGLVAMGGEEGSMEMALARSLVERMGEGDARKLWTMAV
jgi:hypothetical protein